MTKSRLSYFPYQFDRGPVSIEEIDQPLTAGNCRLAVQEFFWVAQGEYFPPEALLNPEAILHTGRFLREPATFKVLPVGTVIFAEAIRGKNGQPVDRSPDAFESREDYQIALHTAVLLGDVAGSVSILPPGIPLPETDQPALWHATAVDGATGVWSAGDFLKYYEPVAAKRFG